jgi:hypothetical protein
MMAFFAIFMCSPWALELLQLPQHLVDVSRVFAGFADLSGQSPDGDGALGCGHAAR